MERNARLQASLRRWLIGAGAFNLVAATPLAVPGIAERYLSSIVRFNATLGLPGTRPVPPGDGWMLIVNGAGLALAMTGAILLHASGDPRRRLGVPVANGIGRLLFAILILYYLATWKLPAILVLLAAIDGVLGVVLLRGARRVGSTADPR